MFSNKKCYHTVIRELYSSHLSEHHLGEDVGHPLCLLPGLDIPPAPTHLQVEGHLVEGGIMAEVLVGVEIWDGDEIEMRQG